MRRLRKLFRSIMAIFRTPQAPQPSTPPQDNIERGDDIVVGAPALAPRNITKPVLGGIGVVGGIDGYGGLLPVGGVLIVTPGIWEGQNDLVISGGFYRNGIAIQGANNLSYVATVADDTFGLTYKETAVNAVGVTTVESDDILISGSLGTRPVVAAAPTLTAYAFQAGHEITATIGTFTGADTVSHYWTANDVVIARAGSGTKFTPNDSEIGKTIKFITRGTNAAGTTENPSAASVAIGAFTTPIVSEVLFDFTTGVFPAGVTVARTSVKGTYVDSDVSLKEAAANTPRINHDALGDPIGLYVEKARTNLVADGKEPMGAPWQNLSLGTIDDDYAGDIMGGNGSGRLLISAGSGYNGARYQTLGAAMAEIMVQYYAKSLSGTSNLTGAGNNSGTLITGNWTRYDIKRAGATNFQLDLIGDGQASDTLFFGVGIYQNGKLGESPILTTGATVTRDKEVVTFTGVNNAFYDIRVRFPDGTYQDFTNQAASGTWILDADMLLDADNKNIVKNVGFYALGGLPNNETPPVVPPPLAPTTAKDLGDLAMIGDELVLGSLGNHSVASAMNVRLNNGGWNHRFVGTQVGVSVPGDHKVSAAAAWTITNLNSDRAALVALNPRTMIVVVQPNNLATMAAGIVTYLNNLVADLGGLTNRKLIVAGPYSHASLNAATLATMKSDMQQWAAAGINRAYANLDNANLQPADYDTSGELLSATGADKVAGVIMQTLITLVPAVPPPPPPPPPGSDTFYGVERIISDMKGPNDGLGCLAAAPNTCEKIPPDSHYTYISIGRKRSDGQSYWPGEYLSDNVVSGKTVGSNILLIPWYVFGRKTGAGTSATNTRLALRRAKLFSLRGDDTWATLATNDRPITGAAWHANFRSPGNETFEDTTTGTAFHQIQNELEGQSIGAPGAGARATWALHGYPIGNTQSRAYWLGIKGIVWVIEARLELDNPSGIDDRGSSGLMSWIGADWYNNGSNGGANYFGELGHARLRNVTNDWQIFALTDIFENVIRANPPPGYS